jgi:hypothetical protein
MNAIVPDGFPAMILPYDGYPAVSASDLISGELPSQLDPPSG